MRRTALFAMGAALMLLGACHHDTTVATGHYSYCDSTACGLGMVSYDMDIEYPEPNTPAARAMYDTMMVYLFGITPTQPWPVEAYSQEYRNHLEGELTESLEIELAGEEIESEYDLWRFRWERDIQLKKNYESRHVVSFQWNGFEFSGGVHGTYWTLYFLFDKQTGAPIGAKDLLVQDSLLLNDLDTLILKELPNSSEFTEWGDYWPEAVAHCDNMIVTDTGLFFYYNTYEIAPYSQGPTAVFINKNKLKPYLNNKSPLYKDWYSKQ